MSNLKMNHYKEKDPSATVDYLKSILKKLDLEVEENWLDESCVGTFSLRVVFKGTNIGTNGKGCTKEYAAASAYAELFERFQNGILCNAMSSPSASGRYDFIFDPNEKHLSSLDIMKQADPFIRFYCKEHGIDGLSIEEQAESYRNVNKLDYLLYQKDDNYTCIPFYNIREKRVVYIPNASIRKNYGSNGMAAGNTAEEALVQAISEIIERVVQKKILASNISLPDVPESYMQRYPYVYEMYKKMKAIDGYKVFMKDCSLGGKYPVAALIVIHQNTGKYGLKMGCHPDFGIAMERTFTEAAQGNDILEYSHRSELDFLNKAVNDPDNIMNSFKIGLAQYPYETFGNPPTYDFVPVKDVSNMTHKEILNEWIKDILDDGYDILVRDVSNLGFPSYHVLIPGLSELRDETDKDIRAENTRAIASLLLSNISRVNKDNCKYIVGCLAYYSNKIMENGLASFIPDVSGLELPFGYARGGSLYMSAMCYAMCEKYDKAYMQMHKLFTYLSSADDSEQENVKQALLVRNYMASRSIGNSHQKTIEYLKIFFDEKPCERIDYLFCDNEKILVKQYPEISQLMERDERLAPHRLVNRLVELLRKYRLESMINQQSLENVFC